VKTIEECAVGIAGLGLMGGAIAMALRNNCGVSQDRLFACDINSETLARAKEAGLISKGWRGENAGEMLAGCDLVFLCLYPAALMDFLAKWEHAFAPGTLVTDIAGIKRNVAAAAEKLRADIDFIPGHPMAGLERGGFANAALFIPGHPMAGLERGGFANAALCNFSGKNYILTPLARNKPENLQFLKDLICRMGFGRVTETGAAEHDSKIAFTSQLCHVIAAALIDCEADTSIARFGGGSFEDFTRIAMLNAPMWAELFTSNRDALLERIDLFGRSMDEIKTLISLEKKEQLERKLTGVRERRIAIGGNG